MCIPLDAAFFRGPIGPPDRRHRVAARCDSGGAGSEVCSPREQTAAAGRPTGEHQRGGPVTTLSPGLPGAPTTSDEAPRGRDGGPPPGAELLESLLATTADEDRPVTHVHSVPVRERRTLPWPEWVGDPLRERLQERGVASPYAHQVEAAQLAHDGRHVVVATGTASGKSLAYQLPALSRLAEDPRACVLYLAPTKALARDQLAAVADARRPLGAAGGLRRRHPRRGARLGAPPLAVDRDQPRHAAPRDPAGPPEVVEHPAPGRLRRHRRVPRLPRRLRLPRRPRAAPAAPDLPSLRRGAGVRAGVGDRRRARRGRLPAGRASRWSR